MAQTPNLKHYKNGLDFMLYVLAEGQEMNIFKYLLWTEHPSSHEIFANVLDFVQSFDVKHSHWFVEIACLFSNWYISVSF